MTFQDSTLESTPQPERGMFLRRMRDLGNLTLKEVEDRSGLSVSYTSQLERGLIDNFPINRLTALVKGYGLPVEHILQAYGIEIPLSAPPDTLTISTMFTQLDEADRKAVISYAGFLVQQQTHPIE